MPEWAWQPFGPDETIFCFTLPGSHYRGFPVIKVSDEEKRQIESGLEFQFKYKDDHYIAANGQIRIQTQ